MEKTEVSVRLGTTLNIGNFQNVKLEIEVRDYVRPDDENTSSAIDRVYNLVDAKLTHKAESFTQ